MIPGLSENHSSNPHPVAPRAGCGNKAGFTEPALTLHGWQASADFTLAVSRIPSMVNAAPSTEQTPSPAEPESYEQALAELEKLVSAMEGAQLPLDDLLKSYRRGAQLLAFCRARLQAVEQQVKVLERGQLEPFDGA